MNNVVSVKKHVLVLANVTAGSDDLCRALTSRAQRSPAAFTLVVPATRHGGGREAAKAKLDYALNRLREAGLEADGAVGHPDPIVAVDDAWDPRRFDEIVVSTLPIGASKWLHAGLPERVGKLTGAPVTHVVVHPAKPPLSTVPPPEHTEAGLLKPLTVLGWGAHPDDEHAAPHKREQRGG